MRWSPAMLLLLALAACAGSSPDSREVTVFAAASLREPFTALAETFEAQHPGVRVTFNFAGSQALAQQLNAGAAADVFASADARQMDWAVEGGSVADGSAAVIAHNRLVVILPPENPAGIQRLADLARPGVRVVVGAEDVPAGAYARQWLDQAAQDPAHGEAFRDQVLANVVSLEESVAAIRTKVLLGEADAGVVYASDTAGQDLLTIEIPAGQNVQASYYIAPVLAGPQPDLARAFIDFVLSAEGQRILAESGLIPAGETGE